MAPLVVIVTNVGSASLPPMAPELPATMGILKVGFIIVLAIIAVYALIRAVEAMRDRKSVLDVAGNSIVTLLAVAAVWQLANSLLAGTSVLPGVVVSILEKGAELIGADLSSAIKSLRQ